MAASQPLNPVNLTASAAPPPVASTMPGNFSKDIEIDPDQVVAVASLFDEQFDQLNGELARSLAVLKIRGAAEDLVSVPMAKAWNQLVVDDPASYVAQIRHYLEGLNAVIAQLRDAAKKYRLIDEKNADVFKERKVA